MARNIALSLEDEELVVRLLQNKGLRAERFSKAERREGKTPDFRVFKDDVLKSFCEVKSVEKDAWLDKKLDAATLGEIVGGLRDDPVFNRLTDDIHKAVAQFLAVNPDAAVPNLVVFVNHDSMCDEQDVAAVLSGQFLADEGTAHRARYCLIRIIQRIATYCLSYFPATQIAFKP